ncbi:MAG: hypothetical protein HY960_04165 [Ignavibacteriae bacterium]|nr:hypothetical protein [Ignavibacteriota bacterium]
MKYFFFFFALLFSLLLIGCTEQTSISEVESGNSDLTYKAVSKELPENINSHILVNTTSKNPSTGALYYINGKISYSYVRSSGKYELKTTLALTIREILLKRVTVFSLQKVTLNEGENDDNKQVFLTNEYELKKDESGTLSICLDYHLENYVTLISAQVK